MARTTFEAWIPEEFGGPVLSRIAANSAVDRLARKIPMKSDAYRAPRSGVFNVNAVAKGAAYGETTSANDTVLLDAVKIGGVSRIAQEDLDDTANFINILDSKKLDAADSYARYLDNACLGVNATQNLGTVPFTSLYRSLTTANAATGYTANSNRILTVTGQAATFAQFSDLFGLVEEGNYANDASMIVIAHPVFKRVLRNLKDDSGSRVFEAGAGDVAGTLFGVEVVYSTGAKVTTVATDTPSGAAGAAGASGNPLLFVGNRDYLLLGVRQGLGSQVADSNSGAGFLTDEALLKVNSRNGFAVGYEQAFAVLEDIA